MDLDRIRLHGLLRREHGLKICILDIDKTSPFLGRFSILCKYGADRVRVTTDDVPTEKGLITNDTTYVIHAGDITVPNEANDPFGSQRRLRIDAQDFGMRPGRSHNGDEKGIGWNQI